MFKKLFRDGVLYKEFLPFTFVVILWIIHLLQAFLQTSWADYGLMPRTKSGILGIFTMPFLHADFEHLGSNTAPLLVMGLLFFYFYRKIAHEVFFIMFLLTGALTWAFARGNSYHIGASGLVYGLAAFLFFGGVFTRQLKLMVISLLVAFMYGGMVWYVFPIEERISWEGHLFGALSGAMLAYVYRKSVTPQKKFEHETEPDDSNDNEWLRKQREALTPQQPQPQINYEYKPKNETTDPFQDPGSQFPETPDSGKAEKPRDPFDDLFK